MNTTYLTPKEAARLEAWKIWARNMKMLRDIHNEIAPLRDARRKAVDA